MARITELTEDQSSAEQPVEYGPQRPSQSVDLDFPMLNGKGTDWQPLSESNWEEELERIPLFMNKAPTHEELQENPELQALQSLIYDGTPLEIAQSFKQQANELLQSPKKDRRVYQEAQKFYEKSLAQKCGDLQLEISVLSNLAHVHFQLSNYRSSFESCLRAFKSIHNSLDSLKIIGFPVMVKLYYRMCRAYLALSKIDECRQWLDKATEFCSTASETFPEVSEKDVENYSGLFKNIETELKQAEDELERRREIKRERERAIHDKNRQLASAINERQLTIIKTVIGDDSITPASIFPCPHQFLEDKQSHVHLTNGKDGYPANSLNWPVLLIYPQLNTFDMIGGWNESVSVMDQLEQQVLCGKRDDLIEAMHQLSVSSDDKLFEYTPETVAAYVLSKDGKWKRAGLLQKLGDLLKQTVVSDDLVVRVWIVPKLESQQREFTRQWIKLGPRSVSN